MCDPDDLTDDEERAIEQMRAAAERCADAFRRMSSAFEVFRMDIRELAEEKYPAHFAAINGAAAEIGECAFARAKRGTTGEPR